MSMAAIVRKICRTEIDRLWTTAIARVDAVYREEGRVRITMKDTINGETITLPSVPVVMPKHGNSAILMPISVGDTVVVAFMKTSTSGSLRDGDIHPGLRQQWTLKNAVVIATVPLDTELGNVLYGDEVYEIPESGIHIVSDEGIRAISPCVDIPSPILQGSEEGVDSTTSGSYVEAFRFNFVTGPWKYVIHYACAISNSSGGQRVGIRIQFDDTITLNEGERSPASGGAYSNASGIYFLDLTGEGPGPNSHHIDFDFLRPSGGTAYIRRKRIVIYKVIENVGCPIP